MHSFVLALTCIAYTINTGPPACKGWLHPWLQLHYYSGCISICCSDTKIGIDWLLDGYGTFWKHFLRSREKIVQFLVICSAWNCRPERLDLRDLWTFFGLRKSWRSDCPAIQTCFRRQSSGKRECPPLRPHQSLQNQEKRCFFNVPRDFFPLSKSCCLILENEYHSLVIVLGLLLSITVTRSVSPMGRKLMFTLLAF